MTPPRLVELVARALGRKPNRYELDTWGPVLTRINDDDADAALIAHRASSPHPPQPADVLKHAIVIGNDRAMRQLPEPVQGVPPTPEFLAELERIRQRVAAKADREPATFGSFMADTAAAVAGGGDEPAGPS